MNEDLKEEIYIEVPPRFSNDSATKKVCKQKKTLYRLKQSPRARFKGFAKVIKNKGNKQSQGDHTLLIKHSNLRGVTTLLVYVDNTMTRNDELERQTLRQCLTKEFEIKELGRLKYFLGIEVAHSKQGIFISRREYVTNLLKEIGKLVCKPASTPIDPNHSLERLRKILWYRDVSTSNRKIHLPLSHKTGYSICYKCD